MTYLKFKDTCTGRQSFTDRCKTIYKENIDDDQPEIARINHDLWEIEESFRIMKSEFDTRTVFL